MKFQTSELVAYARAAGCLEGDPGIRSPDYMAKDFLGPVLRFALLSGLPWVMKWSYEKIVPGVYLYHLARVRAFDNILSDELSRGIKQVVVLGAGLDSRPYRFADRLSGVRVFEVDHPIT